MLCVYIVLIVLLCFNAIAEYTPPLTANGTLPEPGSQGNTTLLDGFCTFYVKPPASVPIVVYDLIFSSTLVYCFVKPLLDAQNNNKLLEAQSNAPTTGETQLEKTTKKALLGARITLLASFLNFMSLVLFAMVR
jgi:hypothetical protein